MHQVGAQFEAFGDALTLIMVLRYTEIGMKKYICSMSGAPSASNSVKNVVSCAHPVVQTGFMGFARWLSCTFLARPSCNFKEGSINSESKQHHY